MGRQNNDYCAITDAHANSNWHGARIHYTMLK
ncbi:hypothetical protein J762_4272, partial [Acinetobacter baumannii 24845_9]